MKKLFTLIALFSMAFATTSWAQSSLRLMEVEGQIHVQAKLGGDVTLLPGPGADQCNLNPNTDTLLHDVTFTIGYDPAEVSEVNLFEEMCVNDFHCLCTRWGAYYGICITAPGNPDPGLVGSSLEASGTHGGINWQTYGSFDAPCENESTGWYNYPVKWENDVYYTLAILDVALVPAPPGSDPLALTDVVSLDEGVWNAGLPNNLAGGNFTNNFEVTYPQLQVESTPTPLSLLAFDASKEGDKSAKLSWTTANEISTKLFVVQRSSNRDDWNDIGGVEAAGFSSGVLDYSFVDKNVYNGRSEREMFYYRLKMVDRDDQFEYSNIDVVSFNTFGDNENTFDLYVFPNPAKDGVNVEINQVEDESPITRLELLDITGRVVYSRDFDSGSLIEYVDFDRYNVTAGTYVLKATDATGSLKAHEKIVVTR